jgi:hypothetical protein
VAEIVLDSASIVAIIGELVAACMPQHVAVDEEAKASSFTGPGDHALVAKRRRPGDPRPSTSLRATGSSLGKPTQ